MHAQIALEINGTIVENGGTPIPYANIHIDNTGIGTAANADGRFQLRTNNSLADSVLVISCLGYNTTQISIRSIDTSKQLVVSLKQAVQTLQEVEVTPLDASAIVRHAIENIFENYRPQPHRLDAFYRTTIKENNSFTRLLEAAVSISDVKGTVFGDRAIDIRQIRKSNDLRRDKWGKQDGYVYHLIRNHPLQAQAWDFLKKGHLNDFNIELRETRFQDKEVFYVVTMTAKKPSPRFQYDVELTINERNFAIVDIVIFWKPEQSNHYTWAWEQRDSAKFVAHWQQSHYTFQEFEGKYYLKSSQWHRKGKIVSKPDNKTLYTTESLDELLVTNIEKGRFSNVTRNFGTTDVYLIADKIPYDEEFWKTYNRPVDSEHFRNAKRQLEKNESLETQYPKFTGQALTKDLPAAKRKNKK